MYRARLSSWAAVLVAALALAACAATPDTPSGTEELVRQAQATLTNFQKDPEMAWFRDNARKARAIVISPRITRAGLVFGGAGGQAVVLARDEKTGRWTGPAFYNIGAGSVGFQIGVDLSEVVIVVMTEKALNALLSPSFKVGADASIAAGPVGVGAASTVRADMVSYARSKGAYAGVSLEGTVIRPDADANRAFYGKPASPVDILVRANVAHQSAAALRDSLERIGR